MSDGTTDHYIFQYPLYTAGREFQFASGDPFMPELQVDDLGRHAPQIVFWDESQPLDVDLSVLMGPCAAEYGYRVMHPNRKFNDQVISRETRARLVEEALQRLRDHHKEVGRFRVVWEDYCQLPAGWPDPARLVAELQFLFPSMAISREAGASHRDPIIVTEPGTTSAGAQIVQRSVVSDPQVNDAFDAWLKSKGFVMILPEDGGHAEIWIEALIDSFVEAEEEETGWWLRPLDRLSEDVGAVQQLDQQGN